MTWIEHPLTIVIILFFRFRHTNCPFNIANWFFQKTHRNIITNCITTHPWTHDSLSMHVNITGLQNQNKSKIQQCLYHAKEINFFEGLNI